MNAWHAVADSDTYRWIIKRGPTSRIFRSGAYRRIDVERNRLRTSYWTRNEPLAFATVRTYCCFIGHNKSGSSMLGGLLDAHPRVVVSDELDALRYVDAGFRRDQLFTLLRRGATAEARGGRVTARRLEPYSYAVEGWCQGQADRPLVMGDTTTGTTTRRLGSDPALLDLLHTVMAPADVRFVQVIRNPFDPISVMMVRGKRSFADAIELFFTACDSLAQLRRRIEPGALLAVRHEQFVAAPRENLASLCAFLGVEPPSDYLTACASIIRPTPDRRRDMVQWTPGWIAEVERRITSHDFLEGYGYER
jgi:hypothetical protein